MYLLCFLCYFKFSFTNYSVGIKIARVFYLVNENEFYLVCKLWYQENSLDDLRNLAQHEI